METSPLLVNLFNPFWSCILYSVLVCCDNDLEQLHQKPPVPGFFAFFRWWCCWKPKSFPIRVCISVTLTVTLTSSRWILQLLRFTCLFHAIQVKDTPSCKWRPSQRWRQYKPFSVDFTVSFSSTLGVVMSSSQSLQLESQLQYWSSNLMNIICIHGQTAGVEVVPVAPALVSQNIEGSNGANGASEPEDSTRFLIQLCFVDWLEVWHHNFLLQWLLRLSPQAFEAKRGWWMACWRA